MREILATYRKTVKLSAGSIDHGRPIRDGLEQQVYQAVEGLKARQPDLLVTRSTDENGNSSIKASSSGFEIVIGTRFGLDYLLQQGERRSFVSYTISASTNLRALDRAASASREITFLLRGLGIALFVCLFYWGINRPLRGTGWAVFVWSKPLFVFFLLGGGFVGERVGNFIGNKLESVACASADQSGSLPQLELLWDELDRQFNTIMDPHELV